MKIEDNNYYRIGEVAKILGISKRTIRRYERNNVFPDPKRSPVNNWREYTPKDIRKLRKILGRLE